MTNETKIKKQDFDPILIYSIFSKVPLDIEGSNLQNTGWMPSKKDISYMGEESYNLAVEECNLKNAKVIFNNVLLHWDSCDCGDGYGCPHGSYVCDIEIISKGEKIAVEYTDGDCLEFYNDGKCARIPTEGATIYDFFRACELCEIELEFSDYAISILKI